MAYSDEYVYSGNAVPTTLASDASGGVSTTLSLTSATGWPSPTGSQKAIATLNYGTSSEVKITYTGKSGNDLTGVTWDFDDTTASGTYSAGTPIQHSIAAVEMEEFNYVKRETVGKITASDRFLVSDGVNSLAEKTAAEVRTLLAVLPSSGGTFTGDVVVPDEAYDATAWNGSLEVPTKNAVRDKIESLPSGGVNELSYASATANQTGIGTTYTAVTGVSVTITVGSNPVIVRAQCLAQKKTAAGYVAARIYDVTAGSAVQTYVYTTVTDGRVVPFLEVRLTPAAGSRTYRLELAAENNTVDMLASASSTAWIQVLEVV